MAEAAVTFILEKLSYMTVKEWRLLRNVHQDVREIKNEFDSMKALLKDADAKAETEVETEQLKVWVKEIREISYETEDVLDEFLLLHSKQPQRSHGTCGSVMDLFHRITTSPVNLKSKHQIANQIEDIKARLLDISKRKERYGLNTSYQASSSNATQYDPRLNACFLEDSEILGINEPKAKLIGWLEKQSNSKLGVVSVFGTGGLGKTTLVKKVYDDPILKSRFYCRAWITVSQTYEIKSVLTDLGNQLGLILPDHNGDVKRMKDAINNYLKERSYVVVLDDIWTVDAWNDIKHALPQGQGTSHILVTTRSGKIAETCIGNHGYAYQHEPLSPEDALQLFCKKAFHSEDVKSIPTHLEGISNKLLHKCKGLPLAIISIAGLLRTKKHWEWDDVYDKLGYLMRTNEEFKDLNSILALSYFDLPYHLKSCFLYLSIYPEDYSIECEDLLCLWVAEGFVQQSHTTESMTKQDIARVYLQELIYRSLVQAETATAGTVTTCRVHDVLREFIIMKALDQDFVAHSIQQHNGREALQHHIVSRRLSILSYAEAENLEVSLQNINSSFSHLRSVTFFVGYLGSGFLPIISSFKLLRVLKLNGMVEFPCEISCLFYLRYLRIADTGIVSIPSSLGKLKNLEILDVKSNRIVQLPEEIRTLKHLTHLKSGRDGFKLPVGIDSLSSLELLSMIDTGEGNTEIINSLGMLTRMRNLQIVDLLKEHASQLMTSVQKMKYLRRLYLYSADVKDWGNNISDWPRKIRLSENLDVENLAYSPQYIQELRLDGVLQICPKWFHLLHNMVKMTLMYSRIEDDSLLKCLQRLPNLEQLKLLPGTIYLDEFHFDKDGFPSLKELVLYGSPKLKRVKVEKGAMPVIEFLCLIHCSDIERPVGIEHLITLKRINVQSLGEELMICSDFPPDTEEYRNHGAETFDFKTWR